MRHRRLPPKYYNAGSRIGQIQHARLLMGCSSLNSLLYSKNIVPSPSCACGEFESCPASILHKSIAGRYRPVRVADGPITDRCRFIKNASWVLSFFFLYCPRYSNVRNTYLSGYLHTHSVQELLHGKVTATDENNETMLCHVQEFIVRSKRFLWYKGTNVTLMQIILREKLWSYGVMDHIYISLSVSLSLCLSLCIFDIYARARISVCMCLCTCLNACVYVYMYRCMYVCMYVRTYACTYMRTYVRMYVCAYVCMLRSTYMHVSN